MATGRRGPYGATSQKALIQSGNSMCASEFQTRGVGPALCFSRVRLGGPGMTDRHTRHRARILVISFLSLALVAAPDSLAAQTVSPDTQNRSSIESVKPVSSLSIGNVVFDAFEDF